MADEQQARKTRQAGPRAGAGSKKKKFDFNDTVNSKQKFIGPKATEGSVGNYVNNVRASKDYYDKQEQQSKKDKIKERQKKLEKEQSAMMKSNFYTGADKEFRKMESNYKKVDPGFKKGKNKDKIIDSMFLKKDPKKSKRVFDEMDQSRREAGRTTKAKGGRAGYKKGGAAIRGVSKILR